VSDIVQFLLDHKEALGLATSVVGVFKTAYDMIQSRSRASARDKLLLRVQGLMAVRQAMNSEGATEGQQLADLPNLVKLQLSEALSGFAKASKEVTEKQVFRGETGLFQRTFLLYKPTGLRVWVPQTLTWLTASCIPFFLLGTSIADEGDGSPSWAAFVQNWERDPPTYFGLLFLLGVFLLVRSWAISERRRYLQKQGTSGGAQGAAIFSP
jgi:hypothetical protein